MQPGAVFKHCQCQEEKEEDRKAVRVQGNEFAGHPDAIDMDIQALEGGNHFLHGDPSDDDYENDNDENMGSLEDEEMDDDDEVQRHVSSPRLLSKHITRYSSSAHVHLDYCNLTPFNVYF